MASDSARDGFRLKESVRGSVADALQIVKRQKCILLMGCFEVRDGKKVEAGAKTVRLLEGVVSFSRGPVYWLRMRRPRGQSSSNKCDFN